MIKKVEIGDWTTRLELDDYGALVVTICRVDIEPVICEGTPPFEGREWSEIFTTQKIEGDYERTRTDN